jgi:hypothetical protein
MEDNEDFLDKELDQEYQEISLFDFEKTYEENIEDGIPKYILLRVSNFLSIERNVPTPSSKVLVDFEIWKEQYFEDEMIPIDYDSHFGLRLLAFQNYNSDFFNCDERVMFEALIIKFRAFGFKSFYWSKAVIWKEVGIKKSRASKIISYFEELGIISTQVKTTYDKGRPLQTTYFYLDCNRILKLAPNIYSPDNLGDTIQGLEDYLKPRIKK